jgi:antimicrobial peptide system SdpB family protein
VLVSAPVPVLERPAPAAPPAAVPAPPVPRAARPAPATPWTNVYGLARSLLALGTLLTLLAHDTHELLRPLGTSVSQVVRGVFLARFSLYAILPETYLEAGRWFSIAVLLLVISGWRPRVTGVLHWWVCASYSAAAVLVDGGDQVTAVLTLLLIPVTLTDGRTWHWSPARPASSPSSSSSSAGAGETARVGVPRLIALSVMLVIRLQVSIIYFQSGVAKLEVPEWANGTALYYWFTHPVYGLSPWRERLFMPLLTNPLGVTLATWGVMAFEVMLFTALVMNRTWWKYLLPLGIAFHFGIVVVHGLVSFFFAMAGALVLYLRPWDEEFRFLRRRPAAETQPPAQAAAAA